MASSASLLLSRFLVLLVVVDFRELGVDDVFFRAFRAGALRTRTLAVAARLLLGLLIHRLTELHRSLRQRIGLGRDCFGVSPLQGFLEVGHGVLDGAALALAHFRAVLGERLLGGVDKSLGVVLRLDLGLALLVFLGVSFGVLH